MEVYIKKENLERKNGVPIRFHKDNELTKLYDEYIEYHNKGTKLLFQIPKSDSPMEDYKSWEIKYKEYTNLKNPYEEIVKRISNQFVKFYGAGFIDLDPYSPKNTYYEYLGKLSYATSLSDYHRSSSTFLFNGIYISRFTNTDDLEFVNLRKDKILTCDIDFWDINLNTIEFITQKKYEDLIDQELKINIFE